MGPCFSCPDMCGVKKKKKMPELDNDQKAAVRWVLDNLKSNKGVLLADRMGKGKTAPAIEVLKIALKMNKPGLIIAPAFLIYNWLVELEKWGIVDSIEIIESTKQVLTNAKIYLVSYDTATKYKFIFDQLFKREFSLIICDEAHYLKSWNSLRSRYILGTRRNKSTHLRNRTHRMLLLTGTPVLNNVEELYNVISRISPVLNGVSRDEFIYKYAAHIEVTPWGLKHRDVKNVGALRTILSAVMLSRSNIDGLTDRIDEYIRFKLKGLQLADYILQEELFLTAHNVNIDNIEQLQNLNKFEAAQLAVIRQEVGVLKVPLYLDALSDTLENEPNVVIFCYYRKTQEVLQGEIEKRFSTKCIVINGGVDKKKRFEMCQDFQAGKTKIILATISALREGVNLTAGHSIDFIEFDWTPSNMEQAIARLHRRGQEKAVKVRYFAFDGGIDKYMLRTLEQKSKMIGQIMLDNLDV